MKALFPLIASLLVTAPLMANNSTYVNETQTVPYVDLSRYLGTWYNIASKPTKFEHDCFCSRQVLANVEGKLRAYLSCNRYAPNGEYREINGSIKNVDPSTNAKLRAKFNFFVKLDYWVIGLADDYSWAVVTDPDGELLYIISKTPELSEAKLNEALRVAAKQRDITEIRPISHENCSYPTPK